jgi:hypothetical protein
MQEALFHSIALLISAAVAFLGRFVARQPNRMIRFFTGGARAPETGIFIGFSRVAGWFFLIMGCLGVALYTVLIPIDFLHAR